MTILNAAGSNDKEVMTQALKEALSDFYNKGSDTNLEKIYQALACVLTMTDRDISAVRNDNVLSASVVDETVTRGITNADHLGQEGAFEITRVGFTPSGFIRNETHRIETTNTVIFLESIPASDRIRIFNANDSSRAMASEVLVFNENDNVITVAGVANPGLYTFEYVDVGNTTKETETIQVPAELFQIGWNEGGFGNFGFGE
jgi:hypothetical protein